MKIGIVGLGVMGWNLGLNFREHGFSVVGFDTDRRKRSERGSQGAAIGLVVADDFDSLVALLPAPRTILILVPAGQPVDAAINELGTRLAPNDIILDGGNSHFLDTDRRHDQLAQRGIRYMGIGISGGEEGARHGPCLMPGGEKESYERIAPLLQAVAAKVDGEACCSWVGARSAGHYVKMIHNGIEYGVMQAICEIYDLLRTVGGLTAEQLAQLFARWNSGRLSSFLVAITAEIFAKIEPESGKPLVELILDQAEQKGTGRWATETSLLLGIAVPSLIAAVEARILSALKPEREALARQISGPNVAPTAVPEQLVQFCHDALLGTMISCYAQGFALIREGAREYRFGTNLADVARIWRGGCIIRSRLLDEIEAAYRKAPDLRNLLLSAEIATEIGQRLPGWREAVVLATRAGIPILGLSGALSYVDSYRASRLPANLLQAQRDYFGAHTFRRIDRPGAFHVEWNK